MFPAQFLGSFHVILGSGSVTSKSMERMRVMDENQAELLTILPRGTVVSNWHVWISMREGTWETVITKILRPNVRQGSCSQCEESNFHYHDS